MWPYTAEWALLSNYGNVEYLRKISKIKVTNNLQTSYADNGLNMLLKKEYIYADNGFNMLYKK